LIGGITGFTSIILGWFFKGRQRRKFNKFMQMINENFNTIDNNEKDKVIQKFKILRQNIFILIRKVL
jgi:hypothetical protein